MAQDPMALPAAASEIKVKEKKQEVEQEAKQEVVEHPDFSGKWKIISSEGLAEFCEAAGITGMQYTFQKKSEVGFDQRSWILLWDEQTSGNCRIS